jgi:hypothetical protein
MKGTFFAGVSFGDKINVRARLHADLEMSASIAASSKIYN